MMASISIITVCYNDLENLKKTVDSVRSQTFQNIEHIIVDGASNDGTEQYLRGIKNEKTRIISEMDKGLYDAMNKGMKMVHQDYFLFLNAGDVFHEKYTIEKVFENSEEGSDFIYGKVIKVNEEGSYVEKYHKETPEILTVESFKQGMVVSHQAMIVHNSLMVPFETTFKISADIDWAIRTVRKAKSIHFVDICISDFLMGGLSTKQKFRSWLERWQILQLHFGLFSTIIQHINFFRNQIRFYFLNNPISI